MDLLLERVKLSREIESLAEANALERAAVKEESDIAKAELLQKMREHKIECLRIKGAEDVYIKVVERVPPTKLTLQRFRETMLEVGREEWTRTVKKMTEKVLLEKKGERDREKHGQERKRKAAEMDC